MHILVNVQVDDAMTLNSTPRWNSATTQLITGSIYNDPAGNVGIGTANPVMPLQLKTYGGFDGNANQFLIRNNLYFDYVDNRGEYLANGYATEIDMNQSNGDIEFFTAPSGLANGLAAVSSRLIIKNNGNVGIGTASPGSQLEIGRNAAFTGRRLRLLGYATTAGTDANLEIGDGSSVYWRMARNNGNNFQTDMSGTWGIIGGNVGIGTPTPAAKLDVNGNARVRGDAQTSEMRIDLPADGYLRIGGVAAVPGIPVGRAGFEIVSSDPLVGRQLFALRHDGTSVMIPDLYGFRITSSDEARDNFVFYNSGHLWVRESPVLYSDSRIKLDQRGLDYGLEQVMALKPKRYNRAEWEEDKKTGKIIIHPEKKKNDIGLVAQDIQEIIPEAVVVPEKEGEGEGEDKLLGIAYPKLIPVLIKAIQDQQKQIEKLEDKITHLERKIKD